MSPTASGAVQPQWNVLETALLARNSIVAILCACAEEDVQGQAILALEGLGFGLIIDEDRRAEGLKALRTFRSRIVHQLRLTIGLSKGGLAMHISQSQNLIASFLIVCVCKVCFNDETTGAILFEMIKKRGIHDRVPVLSWQIVQVVNAISGYQSNLEGILPADVFDQVLESAKQRLGLTNLNSIDGALGLYPVEKLAEILSEVFTALQDIDVRCVTIEGITSAVWLTTFFLWLCPTMTDYFVNRQAVLHNPDARVLIHWTGQRDWEIRIWRLEPEPFRNLLWRDDDVNRNISGIPHYDYYPIHSAKSIIATTSSKINAEALESIGQLAGGLVDTAVSKGRLWPRGNAQDSSSAPLNIVALIDICSQDFLTAYPNAMARFGWTCDSHYRKGKSRVTQTLRELNYQRPEWHSGIQKPSTVPYLDYIKSAIDSCYKSFQDTHAERILPVDGDVLLEVGADFAIHLAAEALLESFCNGTSYNASFRWPEGARLSQGADILGKLLFGDPLTFADFRKEGMKASLINAPEISEKDLAVVSNGYVAYSAVLESVDGCMTDQRLATEIRVVPGSLKLANEKEDLLIANGSRYERLVEESWEGLVAGRKLDENPVAVQAFDNVGAYKGFEILRSPNACRVQYLVTPSYGRDKRLLLKTYLQSEEPVLGVPSTVLKSPFNNLLNWSPPASACWADSIEAVAFAQHITEHSVVPEQVRALARLWRERGYFGNDRLRWTLPGHLLIDNAPEGRLPRRQYVAMTHLNEQLRFFEAGYMSQNRRLFIRHAPPLEQCLADAFSWSDEATRSGRNAWVIIT